MSPTHDDDLRALFDSATYTAGVPYLAIDRLRRRGPVVWVPEPALHGVAGGTGYWAVLGHRETRDVLRDAATFSSHVGGTQLRTPANPSDLQFVQQMMLNQDPPDHGRLRRLLSRAFVPRAVAALETEITDRARTLVERVARSGQRSCDLVADIVGDLPVAVLAAVLGVPEQDRALLYDWSNRVIGYQDADYAMSSTFDPASGTPMARAAVAERPYPGADGRMPDPRTREGLADMYAYANALAAYKRTSPGDDIVSLLLGAEVDGSSLSNEEFETMFFLFAVAGNETLRNGIPGAVLTLIEHPHAYTRLLTRADVEGGFPDSAVEELLRFWPPVIHFRRTATADVELGGRWIAKGDKVAVYHAAANRDPAVFADPHRFDPDRSPNDHVTFGYGPHFCIGAHLARLQLRSMLTELSRQLGRLEVNGEPVRLQSNFQQGLKSLPVRW
ncbi:MAG: cytochrome P450 [Actinomycetota bacterium]